MGLGLTRLDSQVYIYLAKKGPQKGQDISKGLKVQKQQLYRSLKNLQKKGIVNSTLEHPARFAAVSFEKIVDVFVNTKMAEAYQIQESKDEILANWQSITLADSLDSSAKFNVIEGRGPVYTKVIQMLKEAKNSIATISTVTGLLRASQFGIFEENLTDEIKSKISFRAITELSLQNLSVTKNFLKEFDNPKLIFEARTPDLSVTLPQIVIRDEEELLFFINPTIDTNANHEDICMWTNCRSLVQAFIGVFEDFWNNSTDIEAKIVELETGKPAPKTYIIKNADSARKKYDAIMQSAEEEITIITSSNGLIDICQNNGLLAKWIEKNITVKIMAPITNDNIETVKQLAKDCEIKHIPLGYLETLVVDGKHLFQFKNPSNSDKNLALESNFVNTFYTNDLEYVEKTRIMLNDLWKNAQAPSNLTLESINRGNSIAAELSETAIPKTMSKIYHTELTIKEENKDQLTEKNIINRMVNPEYLS